MQPINVSIKYRPVKIGWCIRSGSHEDYRKALKQTHTLWGGNFNPVIPIDNFEFATNLTRIFRVDILLPVSEDPEVLDFINKFPHLCNPLISNRLFDTNVKGLKIPRFLDIFQCVQRLSEEKYKNNSHLQLIHYNWSHTDPLNDILLATFGNLPSKEELGADWSQLIEEKLTAQVIEITPQNSLPTCTANNELTLNQLSGLDLKEHYCINNPWRYHGFYIGEINNLEDLVNFWNLRAAGISLMFYDPAHQNRLEKRKKSYIQILEKYMDHLLNNFAGIWHRKETTCSYTQDWNKKNRYCPVDNLFWDGNHIQVSYMYISENSTLGFLTDSNDRSKRLTIQLPEKPIINNFDTQSQYLFTSIEPQKLYDDSRKTLSTPYLPELNRFYDKYFSIELSRSRVEPQGIGQIIKSFQDSLTLKFLDTTKLISEIFSHVSITATISKPGQISQQLIQQMGGLQTCRVFKVEGLRKIIKQFSPYKSFTWSNATQIINNHNFERYNDLYLHGKMISKDDILKVLLERNLLMAGISVQCPNCCLDFWTPIEDVKSHLICEYCRQQFNVTPLLKQYGQWKFRCSGLLAGNDNQHGSIPVILTIQQLEQAIGWGDILYSPSMNLRGDNIPDCESDFVILLNKKTNTNKLELVIGECKSEGGEIDENDIQKLNAIAKAFPAKKFNIYILFSKLCAYTPEELEIISTLNDPSNKKVIIFSTSELEVCTRVSASIYSSLLKDYKQPAPLYAGSFEKMAEITQKFILDNKQKGYPPAES